MSEYNDSDLGGYEDSRDFGLEDHGGALPIEGKIVTNQHFDEVFEVEDDSREVQHSLFFFLFFFFLF